MSFLTICPEHQFAGRCTTNGSNKIWTACLAVEQTDPLTAQNLTDASELIYLCVYGPHGGNLRVEAPQRLAREVALKLFQKKCREKIGKGYQAVPFTSLVEAFGHPGGLSLRFPPAEQTADETEAGLPPQQALMPTVPPFRYTAAVVKPITLDRLQARFRDLHASLSEKVNGERCLLEWDGAELRAYNRKGRLMSAPPEGGRALCRVGCPFVVDGERLTGEHAGTYVLFDVLEWDRKSVVDLPFAERLQLALQSMLRAGLLKDARCTPTYRQARANSLVPNLVVLVPVTGSDDMQAVYEEVGRTGGEGVICRNLPGRYEGCATKYKFLDDIDVFGFDIQEGLAGGSLKLGIVRPSDQAIIEIGHVRAGLSDQDMAVIQRMLQAGQFPVFTVQYLPARTIGLHLVEPRTSLALLRTDKAPSDCTTTQFGPKKAPLIEQATSVKGITLPESEEQESEEQAEREHNALQL